MSSTTPFHRRGIRKPKRRTALGGLAIVTAAGLALTGPVMAAFAAGADTLKVQTSQTVKANLTNTGEFDNGYVFSQVSVTGKGAVVVKNPTSTQGLRNLDGWSGPSTQDGKAVYDVDVNGGTKRFRTVSKFNKDLPVSVDITYRLDGAKISPDDLAGKSGKLAVSYTITNTTAEPTEITYPDGHGQDVTETVDLVTPYVGQLQLVLPDSFSRVASTDNRADQAGDGHGGRLVTWTMVLFEPIGQTVQKFGYTADVDNASIPPAHMQIVPVSPGNHPELKFGQDGFASGAQSGRDVTDAGVQIDDNLLKLQAGAAKLLDGLTQLQEGSATLAAGLTSGADAAIPGSQKLAEGAQTAADGSSKVADGADQVAAGNADLADGLNQLADGAGQLSAGADKLSTGFNDPTTESDLTDGSQALAAALGLISEGLKQLTNAQTGLPAAKAGLVTLRQGIDHPVGAAGTVRPRWPVSGAPADRPGAEQPRVQPCQCKRPGQSVRC
jgi:putative membrane protein